MSISPPIPIANLPTVVPGQYDYLIVAQLGQARKAHAPEVTAAAAALANALSAIVAEAEADIAPLIAGLGYMPPVPFAAGLYVDSSRYTVEYDGFTYAPLATVVPFTTTSTFIPGQWRLIQGVVGVDLASSVGASMIGFLQSGAGAVLRNLREKGRDRMSAKDFGALGNDAGNDAPAIQAAINALSALGGGELYFPRGIYRITTSLVMAANVTLIGDGLGGSVIHGDGNFHVITVPDGCDNAQFINLHIKGAAVNTSASYSGIYAAVADTSDNVLVQNCAFSKSNVGVNIGNGNNWKVVSNRFFELFGVYPTAPSTAGVGYGVTAFGATGGHHVIKDNSFDGGVNSGRHAVYITNGTSYCVVTSNIVRNFNEAHIVVRAELPQPGVVGNIVSNNVCIGGGTVGSVEGGCISVTGVAQNNVVSGNIVSGYANIGILISHYSQGANTLDNVVTGNVVRMCALDGIAVMGSSRTFVGHNVVRSCSQNAPGTYSGIVLRATGSGGSGAAIQPLDNDFIGNSVSGTSHRTSFRIIAAAPLPLRTTILGNSWKQGATANNSAEYSEVSGVVMRNIGNIAQASYAASDSDTMDRVMSRMVSIDFGNIAANSGVDFDIAVRNVTTSGWTVVATPEGVIEAGLTFAVFVKMDGWVTLRVSNITGSEINPAARNWRVQANRFTIG